MMKVVFCEKFGTHKDLVVREIDPPSSPAAGEITVDVSVRSIQFSDIVRIQGNYQDNREPPFIMGGDGVGVVSAVGEGSQLAEGDIVLTGAGCVEQATVPETSVLPLPSGIDMAAASSFRAGYTTALHGLQLSRIQPGESLLVHGAAGGMGLAAVDIGKLMGARVIATASSDDKLAILSSLGADHMINYSDGFRDEVKSLTNGRGADVIFDPVGGDVFDESMRCIAPYGRVLIVGFTSGRPALAKTNHLLVKDAQLIGYTMGGLMRHDPKKHETNVATLLDWLAHGRISPYISHQFPMDDIVDAYDVLVERKVVGKVVITN